MPTSTVGRNVGHMLVIVRSYGDEPVRMVALQDLGNAVEVAREGSDVSIDINRIYVYEYSDEAFHRLSEAFRSGDTSLVRSAWKSATPISQVTNGTETEE